MEDMETVVIPGTILPRTYMETVVIPGSTQQRTYTAPWTRMSTVTLIFIFDFHRRVIFNMGEYSPHLHLSL